MATTYIGRFGDVVEDSKSESSAHQKKRKKDHESDGLHRPQRPKLASEKQDFNKKRKVVFDQHRSQRPKFEEQRRSTTTTTKKRQLEDIFTDNADSKKKRVKIPDNIEFPLNNENLNNPIEFRKATVEDADDEVGGDGDVPSATGFGKRKTTTHRHARCRCTTTHWRY